MSGGNTEGAPSDKDVKASQPIIMLMMSLCQGILYTYQWTEDAFSLLFTTCISIQQDWFGPVSRY